MQKLWRLAERKAETYSGSRNGQSNCIWDRSGGGGGGGVEQGTARTAERGSYARSSQL